MLAVAATITLAGVVHGASPAGPTAVAAADMDASGNAANSVGAIQPCGEIATVGGTLTFDVVVQGVPPFDDNGTPGEVEDDSGGLAGYQVLIGYNPAVLNVTAVSDVFMTAGGFSFSSAVPDSDGDYTAAAATFAPQPLSGDGVLARITLTAVGGGTSPITLTIAQPGDPSNTLNDAGNNLYDIMSVQSGSVVIGGGTCGATPTATPTGTPVDTPTGTATPTGTPSGSETPTPTGTVVPTGTPTGTPDGSETPTETGSPTPTDTPGPGTERIWGDNDCDGEVTTRDNQGLLREILQQNPLTQTEPCPDLGDDVDVEGTGSRPWGDLDCDGEVTSRDNQALLREILQQNALTQTEPCPDLGNTVTIS
jgi:hypothetical protein